MQSESQKNQGSSFLEALRSPSSVCDDDFKSLLVRYPFSKALNLAFQRKTGLFAELDNFQRSLLYYTNKNWICRQVTDYQLRASKIEEKSELFEDPVGEADVIDPLDAEQQAIDDLIEGNVIAGDYFVTTDNPALETKPSRTSATGEDNLDITDQQKSKEDVSVYDDDLLPYSFRWWLYKTRLEHAETYQPFAKPILPQAGKKQFDPTKMEEAILDQQIRENIFHLQDPEDKLSNASPQETIEIKIPKKADEKIEKFIREEPQITPPSPEALNTENKARKSAEDRLSYVTETLARIYIDQGLYPKAVEVYRKLILINPEKKSYFATQIIELENKLN